MSREIAALVHDPDIAPLLGKTYLRKGERDRWAREIEPTKRMMADPIARKSISNPGKIMEQVGRQEKALLDQTPGTLTPGQRDKLAKLETLTREDFIEGMVPHEEMRAKDHDAVDRHVAWEKAKKPSVLLWKTIRRLLEPDNPARDLSNHEKFRPRTGDTRNLMPNALIPRIHTLSPQAKDNYDGINWDSPEAQAQLQKLLDEGKLRINTGVRRGALRSPREGKVHECKHSGCEHAPFSGPMAAARLAKHVKRDHETPKLIRNGASLSDVQGTARLPESAAIGHEVN